MTNTKGLWTAVLLILLSVVAVKSSRADPSDTATAPAVDNSTVNKGATNGSQVTAEQAKNTQSDRDIMSAIRRAVIDDKSLSVYGHNVKIIAEQGKVILKGVVHTQAEKDNIGNKAADVAGEANVTNHISVKGS